MWQWRAGETGRRADGLVSGQSSSALGLEDVGRRKTSGEKIVCDLGTPRSHISAVSRRVAFVTAHTCVTEENGPRTSARARLLPSVADLSEQHAVEMTDEMLQTPCELMVVFVCL
jgi:hypothetical protein